MASDLEDALVRAMQDLAEDRFRLLDRLDLTEHEWACLGGRRFPDVDDVVAEARADQEDLDEVLAADRRRSEDEVDAAEGVPLPPEVYRVPPEVYRVPETPVDWRALPPQLPDDNWRTAPPRLPDEAWRSTLPPPLPPSPIARRVLDAVASTRYELSRDFQQVAAQAMELRAETVEGVVEDPPVRVVDAFGSEISFTEEQQRALDEIDAWWSSSGDQFFAFTGPAGSGKTFLTRAILQRYNSGLAAMTGRAALRLSQLSGESAKTLHSMMYYPPVGGDFRFTRLREAPWGLLIIDEAGMMGPSVFADLQRWGTGFRALLIGDPYQLPPVITSKEAEQWGEDFSVFGLVEGPELQTVMRNAGGVLRAATRVRETGEICTDSDLDAPDSGYQYGRSRSPVGEAVAMYCEDRDNHLLVTWRNEVRMRANKLIRARVQHDGPLPDEGEPVLIRKNGQGLLNGEVVQCGGFETGPTIDTVRTMWMTVAGRTNDFGAPLHVLVSVDGGRPDLGGEFFDGGSPWVESYKKYNIALQKQLLPDPIPVTWGYCVTCHAAQGGQARRTTVFLDRGDERSSNFRKPMKLPSGRMASFSSRWTYTAMTRSEKLTTMLVGR